MANGSQRTQIVLVPGFGGFDALGQVSYYAGVAPIFEAWQRANRERPAALVRFDNLPTAGVRTRALALRDFLDARIAAGEFAQGDRIALVAHSTGGLDVRQLLINLDPDRFPDARPDRTEATRCEDQQILDKVQRLVFMSVPQRGANMADCVQRHEYLVHKEIETLGLAVRASHAIELPATLQRKLAHLKLDAGPQIFTALRDALNETVEPQPQDTAQARYGAALARQAYGELTGWFGNVESDFLAVDDLACLSKPGELPTPARYPEDLRARELGAWAARGITTLSYATLAPPPLDERPATTFGGPIKDGLRLLKSATRHDPETDWVYRLAYAASAAGPFETLGGDYTANDRRGVARRIEAWHNDGIVNTASMLWPNAEKTQLVAADHGDIIGHYVQTGPVRASEQALGRANHSYDILRSNSGFDESTFRAIWQEVFEFATR
jgi:triacylglycerol lipase